MWCQHREDPCISASVASANDSTHRMTLPDDFREQGSLKNPGLLNVLLSLLPFLFFTRSDCLIKTIRSEGYFGMYRGKLL